MTIGIDARLWNETGVGRYIRQLFFWLPKIDKKNKYVWFFISSVYDQVEMPLDWKKVRCDIHWHTFSEQLILPFIFLKENLDLLHIPYFTFPILYPKKFVLTIHDLIYDHFKSGRGSTLPLPLFWLKKAGYFLINTVSVKRAEKILTISLNAKEEIISHYRADPQKISVIYESGALETDKIETTDRMKNLRPYVLYVGNAHPHKNVENLIKAAIFGMFRLVLIGNDPFFYPRLPKSKYVEQIGTIPNSELGGWYKNAAAFVSASKMEGFGIPPLEAMSVGCPVILSDIPVFREINGPAAEYFDHTDPAKIAAKIKSVLTDKKRLKEMVEMGYKQGAKYSWRKMAKEVHKTYIGVLNVDSNQQSK
jgi:glycosyltransferase involved in cell wall biosynthesis